MRPSAMTRLAGCLALGVGIGVTAHGEPASGPWLKLRWHDPTGAFPSASTAIAEELRAIVAPAGLEFDWREMRPGEVSRTAGIDIVLLRAMSPGAALPPSTLGVVRASAAGQPAAW